MITITHDNDHYNIKSKYDPALIDIIKSIPSRKWNPDDKMWTISDNFLGFLINQLKGTQYESQVKIISDEDIDVNLPLDEQTEIPDEDISDVKLYVEDGGQLYSHQIDFLKWAIHRQRGGNLHGCLLADEMGLGKSLEVTNLAMYNRQSYNYKHCLIICCVNSSKYNWKHDIERHTCGVEVPYILGTRRRRDGTLRYDVGGKEKMEDISNGTMYGDASGQPLPYFIILNIEGIRYSTKSNNMVSALIERCRKDEINMIVVDEIHKNASPSSAQGKCLCKLYKQTKNKVMWIPMTGTPITNKPTDVYLPLMVVDGHPYTSFYTWCQQFCIYGGFGGHEIIGYKNMPMLKSMLHPNMIRRLKKDVLNLPPKIYIDEYIENTDYQLKLYQTVATDIIAQRSSIVLSLNPLSKLLRLRQVNGSPELIDDKLILDDDYINKNAKLKRLLELIDEAVERNEKVIVFSNWVEPLRTIYKYVHNIYRTCCFTGTMSSEDRERHKYAFQNDPNCKVLLGTIGAAGTTHTFTAASNVIFYDEPWTPADKVQAEDRANRIGTTSSTNIITLMTQNTVDERVHDILYKKRGISNYIVDNSIDLRKNPDLFDLLLSK